MDLLSDPITFQERKLGISCGQNGSRIAPSFNNSPSYDITEDVELHVMIFMLV